MQLKTWPRKQLNADVAFDRTNSFSWQYDITKVKRQDVFRRNAMDSRRTIMRRTTDPSRSTKRKVSQDREILVQIQFSSGFSPEDEPNSSDSPTAHNSESPSTSQEPSTSNTAEDESETDQHEIDIPTRTQKNHPIQNVIGYPSAGIRTRRTPRKDYSQLAGYASTDERNNLFRSILTNSSNLSPSCKERVLATLLQNQELLDDLSTKESRNLLTLAQGIGATPWPLEESDDDVDEAELQAALEASKKTANVVSLSVSSSSGTDSLPIPVSQSVVSSLPSDVVCSVLPSSSTFQFRARNAQTEFLNRSSTVQENVVYNVDEPQGIIILAFFETFQEVVIGSKLNCTISFLVPIDHIYGIIPVHVLMGSDLGYGQTNWIQKNNRLCIFLSDLKFPTGQL
nr:uncharacterized protein LOC109168701 [Ipomoea trifida]